MIISPDNKASAISNPEPKIRIEFVDGLRALAAIYVVMGHALVTIPGTREGFGTALLTYAHYAVDLFIVLSGFCLALPMTKPSSFGILRGGALDFYKRRARRILPPYYYALAISILLILALIGKPTGNYWDACLPISMGAVVSHLLLVQDFIYTPNINHVMWSIALEWQIYLVLPLIALGWRRMGPVATTAATVAFGYFLFFLVKKQVPSFGGVWIFGYIALFAFGTLAALVAMSPEARWRRLMRPMPWIVITALIAGVLVAILAEAVSLHALYAHLFHLRGVQPVAGDNPQLWIMDDFVMGLLSASLLILVSCPGKNWLRDALSVKPLVFLGTFAYSIYLMHAPLLQVAWQYVILPMHVGWYAQLLILIYAGIPVIVGLCYLFFLACEKPWLVRRRGETMREVAQDAAVSPAP